MVLHLGQDTLSSLTNDHFKMHPTAQRNKGYHQLRTIETPGARSDRQAFTLRLEPDRYEKFRQGFVSTAVEVLAALDEGSVLGLDSLQANRTVQVIQFLSGCWILGRGILQVFHDNLAINIAYLHMGGRQHRKRRNGCMDFNKHTTLTTGSTSVEASTSMVRDSSRSSTAGASTKSIIVDIRRDIVVQELVGTKD